MARIETTVLNLLTANPSIFSIVGLRAFDKDYRADGWQNAPIPVMDGDSVMLPTLVVVNEEGVHPLGAPMNARRQFVIVWAFGNASDEGYDDVQAILDLSNAVLAASAEVAPIPGVDIKWTGEMGPFKFDDGCVGRYDYSISGIPAIGG